MYFLSLLVIGAATVAPVLPRQSSAITYDELSHRAVKFFWEQSNPANGFSKDRAANFADDDHVVASSASVGFALSAYIIGVENGWLSKLEAKARTRITVDHMLTQWPQDHGWFYHFVDWKTGERMWKSEASSIDTSIFLAGLQAADQYWKDPSIHQAAKQIEDRIDWKWMLTDGGKKPNERALSMGWHPEDGFINARWSNFCELTMLYIQAYGFYPDMPSDSWSKIERRKVDADGYTFIEGGPMFLHQMTQSFFDLKNKRDSLGIDYWLNSQQASLAQRAYAIRNPKGYKGYGPNFWGLSASDIPGGYTANGIPPWSSDDGTVTPTAALGDLPYVPKEATNVLQTLLSIYPESLGRYGFSNGINPTKNWHGPDVIGIDLGMYLCAWDAANKGIIHSLTNKDPIVQRGFERMGFHEVVEKTGDGVYKSQVSRRMQSSKLAGRADRSGP